jgi:uncharacterized membrane protein YhaH (DUF805 family)
MGFGEAIKSGFQNYVTFSGRAARSEFWYWALFNALVSIAAGIIDAAVFSDSGLSPINSLASLALFLPSLAVAARRLHDLDRTAWWLLLILTGIGIILLLIWDCMRGTMGSNRYGEDPLGPQLQPA